MFSPITRKHPFRYITIILNIFSETALLTKAEFMWNLLGQGGKKNKNGLGNMIKMAAMPLYG